MLGCSSVVESFLIVLVKSWIALSDTEIKLEITRRGICFILISWRVEAWSVSRISSEMRDLTVWESTQTLFSHRVSVAQAGLELNCSLRWPCCYLRDKATMPGVFL